DAVSHVDDLGDALVAEPERSLVGRAPVQQRCVEIARGDRDRTHDRLAVALERGLDDVAPLDLAGLEERQLLHQAADGCWMPALAPFVPTSFAMSRRRKIRPAPPQWPSGTS